MGGAAGERVTTHVDDNLSGALQPMEVTDCWAAAWVGSSNLHRPLTFSLRIAL